MEMKKLIDVLLGALLIVTTAGATMMVKPMRGNYYPPGFTAPGEFKATVAGDTAIGLYQIGDSFQTFCIEENEHLWFGYDYDCVLNTEATLGGRGGAVNGVDPICPQTAYLYTLFIDEALSNYDFTNASSERTTDGTELAELIHYLEEEISVAPVVGSKAYAWLTDANNAVNNGTWVGLGNVRVLNLYDYDNSDPIGDETYTTFRQDILVISEPVVPEPITMGLLAVGGLMVFRKKRK